MKIAIYGKSLEILNLAPLNRIFNAFHSRGIELIVFDTFYQSMLSSGFRTEKPLLQFKTQSDLSADVKFLVSVGGDGTFLETVSFVRGLDIPILGINTGRLGFLSNTGVEEVEEAAQALIEGKFKLESRSLLSLESESNLFGTDHFALNEISISKRDTSSMITIHVEVDGMHLNSYWTDGLIISTSTGSTAYSLSCGGPILMPGSGNFVITPIAPHNLNVRPIVVSDETEISLRVEGRNEPNLIALDSKSAQLKNNELIQIKKAAVGISLVQLDQHSFIQSLKNKLNWGLDKRNQ